MTGVQTCALPIFEGLVHISEMAGHHVDHPEQVVAGGEELWVKIIDLDLQRRRISLSIKQAAEGGVVAAEYQAAFGEHAYDPEGNYIGEYSTGEFTPDNEAQAAWLADYNASQAAAAAEEAGTEAPAAAAAEEAAPAAEAEAPAAE